MAGRGIGYIKPEEPSFIKQFKEKVGYKEGPTVDTKRRQVDIEEREDRSDDEDEKPQVVVLKDGDLSAAEADKIVQQIEDGPPPTGTKISFKKPTKRSNEQSSDLTTSTKKKKDSDVHEKKKSSTKKVKNSSLLSFGDDEEEED